MTNDKVEMINIYTDGGSRGNPGPSAIGVFIEDSSGVKLWQLGKKTGYGTNNAAEYLAIEQGLQWIVENKSSYSNLSVVNFYMDSQLAVLQLNGLYKVKNPQIRDKIFKIRQKEAGLSFKITYSHVSREQNKKADRLVNLALDNKI